jgi:hypothetical protein
MNKFTKFIYAFLMVMVFTLATAFGQCPPNTWSLNVTINPDQYPEETSWYIMNFFGDTLMQGGPYTNIIDYEPQYSSACAPIDSFYFVINDSYGDGIAGSLWGGNDGSVYIEQCGDTIWTLPMADFGSFMYDTIYTSGCPPPPPVYGCMDINYTEFDLSATLDTGMCLTPVVFGCTDTTAFNYIESANTDINIDSCMHELELTDLAGNGWAGSSLKVSQATNMIPPFNYQDIGTYTLEDGFDTTFFINLAAGYPVKAVFEITQQSDFTAVQCGYSLYSEDYYAIDIEGGFVNPIPPFYPIIGQPYCGNNCIERTYGCTDSTALNYLDTVNTDDGSCYYVAGCMNPLYLEYNELADFDDGSCATLIVVGCMDSTALNYNPLANVQLEGSCIEVVEGCMNHLAFNYNPNANVDDGSCIPLIYGCIDPMMFNYCDTCNTDDGSCIEFIYGCTDTLALNYDNSANTNNGSCIYPYYGCMDVTAINFNSLANLSDSSCYYSAGCPVGDVYYVPNECFEWVIDVDNYCCDIAWDEQCEYLYEYCVDGWSGPTDVQNLRSEMFNIYPNPTKNSVFFTGIVDVKVYDMRGMLIMDKKQVNSIQLTINGLYLLEIKYKEMTIISKINKQ